MSKAFGGLVFIMLSVICSFSYISLYNIDIVFVTGISACCAVTMFILGKKLYINTTLVLWIINYSILLFLLVFKNAKNSSFNLTLGLMIFVTFALVSNYRYVSIKNISLILNLFVFLAVIYLIIKLFIPSLASKEKYSILNVVSTGTAFLLYYSIWIEDKSQKKVKALFILIAILGFFLVAERSNFILIPLPILFIYYFFSENKNKRFIILLLSLIFLVILFFGFRIILYRVSFFARLYDSIDLFLSGEVVSLGRNRMNNTAIMLWKQNPIWGNGWFYYYFNNKNILHNGLYVHTHNFILELLCDCGIVGTAIVLIPFLSAIIDNIILLKKSTMKNSEVYKVTLAMQLFLLTDSFFHVSLYNTHVIGFYFLTLAIMYIHKNQNRRIELQTN